MTMMRHLNRLGDDISIESGLFLLRHGFHSAGNRDLFFKMSCLEHGDSVLVRFNYSYCFSVVVPVVNRVNVLFSSQFLSIFRSIMFPKQLC